MQEHLIRKIEYNEECIKQLQEENNKLKSDLEKNKNVKGIERWVGYEFKSSSGTTEEFLAFVKEFRKYIKENLPENTELVSFNKGHFFVYGFVKKENKYVYFSISDVRFFKDRWYNDVLIRTANDEKDHTGGSNSQISLKDFKEKVDYLLTKKNH